MSFTVHDTTSRGGVLRSKAYKEGTHAQCTAGPIHFDAFVSEAGTSAGICITEAVDSFKPDADPKCIRLEVSSEFAAMLANYFGNLAKLMEHTRKNRPENQLAQAKEALRSAEAQVSHLEAVNKAVRSHKRKPRPKAVPV